MCKHKWVHYDTVFTKRDGNFGSYFYIRTDFFHCEKCLEIKEIRKEKEIRSDGNKPEWWKK